MKNEDPSKNANFNSNNNGNKPCSKCNSLSCCKACACQNGYRLETEKLHKLFKMVDDSIKSQRRIERGIAALVNRLNSEDSADQLILDNRLVSPMKSTMISLAIGRMLNGDKKPSRVLREVFESYRKFAGAYDNFDSFRRQVYRYFGKA